MLDYDLVVVGGVAAGTKAAAKARRERRDWKIAIVTQDADVSYAGCGLPYYIGGVIPNRAALIVKTPDKLKCANDLDIMVMHRALSIDRKARTIVVKSIESGREFQMRYGKLFLATGAQAVRPPIPGADGPLVRTLRSVEDADAILGMMAAKAGGSAVVVGGGFIGIEVAENLHARGWHVTIVEMLPQILPPFDEELALYVQRHIESKGVKLLTGAKVTEIAEADGKALVRTSAGDVPSDLVVMSVGVRPETALAKDAGLELGVKGAIKVDASGRTSDPDIFASGDCATTFGLVSKSGVWAPMGSTANKQARGASLTLTGSESTFPGVLGTMAVKAFEVSAAKTGMCEREAREAGLDAVSVLVPADDRAHYYPGSQKIAVKVVADRKTGRILGAQAYGFGMVDKPIDAFVAGITMGATASDLANADFAYAPPFSTAINPVNLACNVLLNKMAGKMDGIGCISAKRMISDPAWDGLILDTREVPEFMIGSLPGAVNIPNAEIRARLSEIERFRDKPVVTVCNFGRGAYDGYLRLRHLGFSRVKILEGGTRFWPFELA
jgi:NADPH-dependent 2,4-dienoyl-CoA reductase/sulfur reductase-like enzyme/rhodanese-related sulfurtransferase